MAKQKKVLKRLVKALKKHESWSDAQHRKATEEALEAWRKLRDYYLQMA